VDLPEASSESNGEVELSSELNIVQQKGRDVVSIDDLWNPSDEVVGNTVDDAEELVLQAYNKQEVEVESEGEEEENQEPRIGHTEGLEFLEN
jgi:hypothetical protein